MLILLITNDSTSVDTVHTYEIPEIISSPGEISTVGEIVPSFYEQSTMNLLAVFPFFPYFLGFGHSGTFYSKGRDPQFVRVCLDGRCLHVHPLGYVNLSILPLHFFEKIAYGSAISGAELSALNFESRVNRYDRPYSKADFMFGSYGSNIYGMDLTRALTNYLGFYLSGQYYKTDGYRNNTDAQAMSVYSNLYYDRFTPMRLDIFYIENQYGFPGSTQRPLSGRQQDRSLNVSGTGSIDRIVASLFYDYSYIDYVDVVNEKSLAVRTDQYGALIVRNDTLMNIVCEYGAQGLLTAIDGGWYRSTGLSEAEIWASVRWRSERFFVRTGGRTSIANYHETFLCPKAEFGINVTGSIYLSAAVSRDARAPSDFERWAPFDTLIPYFGIAGYSNLHSEYCWTKEIGLRGEGLLLNYYQLDFTDYISAVHLLTWPNWQYANVGSRQMSGVEGFMRYPLRLYNSDSSAMTEFMLSGSFNSLVRGEPRPDLPDYFIDAAISIKRETQRFSFGFAFRNEISGLRRDMDDEEHAGFSVCSLAALLKFMSLSCVVRLNNLFDEIYDYVPYYPMPGRNYDVSVKWEFWD